MSAVHAKRRFPGTVMAAPAATGWRARLDASFVARGPRTVPARRAHEGPLRLQRMLYPEGERVCHAIVVHPPGGVAGGDALDIAIAAQRGAHVLLTTPGAAKWYRSGGATACQRVRLDARDSAIIEWLPQESIVFDRAQARWTVAASAAGDAAIVGLDVVMLGRAARGERFAHGEIAMQARFARADRPAFVEQWRLAGDDARLTGPQGLGCAPCFGTLWALADPARLGPVLDAVRDALDGDGTAATLLPTGVLLVRAVGEGPEAVRRTLERAWSALRPRVLGVPASRPRIWST